MSARRTVDWYVLHDRFGDVAELDIELDRLDIEIDGLRRIQWEETAKRLAALGYDTENLRPSPPMHRSELRASNHVIASTDVEGIIVRAQADEERRTRGRTRSEGDLAVDAVSDADVR